MRLSVLNPPAAGIGILPIADAKLHGRITSNFEDAIITNYINGAVRVVEKYLGRALQPQTFRMTLSQFYAGIQLSYPPVTAVSAVKYLDVLGQEQTLSPDIYDIDLLGDYPIIRLAPLKQWPATFVRDDAVRIEFTAGYTQIADIPPEIIAGISRVFVTSYDNRASSIKSPFVARVSPGADGLDSFRLPQNWGPQT